ncbi:MAG: phosphate acetyl/butyryl transferase [Pisciglobus halotolerans]|nr:phosphate acetyl/butyryl transferase [Pisciglobus halotolerans]
MLKNFEALKEEIIKNKTQEPKRVAVIKAASLHALESIFELAREGLVIPYLIDKKEELEQMLEEMTSTDVPYEIIPADTDQEAAFKGIQMAKKGEVEFIMKGNLQTGTLLKEVVNRDTGIRNKKVLSHMALVEVPAYSKLIGITDGGMVLTPSLEQKEAIIENAEEVMFALGYEKPKFGLLSSAEVVQPKLPASADAAVLTEQYKENKRSVIEGPISLDIALNPVAASEKGYKGQIQGDVDVLVVPEIVTGNALSKSMTLLAGGEMAGVIVGAKVPIILTSRSSTTAEKRNSLLLALKVSTAKKKGGIS